MAALRIVAVRCPCCKGNPRNAIFGICMWCENAGKAPVTTALRYADTLYMLAGGGYIEGDYSFEEMVAQEKEAEAIYDFCQRPLPWKRRSPPQDREEQ